MGPAKPSMQELYASPADWVVHQETITRLYLNEKRSLQEVMEYMAVNHFFFATIKMYRTRIRKWGIDKNNKATEVAYMLKLKKQRQAAGKETIFTVRNRPVDWGDIERYLARTPEFWAKHGDDALDLSNCPRDITCQTPPGSPQPTPQSVPLKLEAAQELRIHEEILRFFRTYTEGSFEQGLWDLSPAHQRYFGPGGARAHARLNAWYDKVRNVSDWPGRDADVVRLVNHMLDDLPQLIKDQDFTLFPALMRCCFYLSARRPALGKAVMQFVAGLCRVILGGKHPMTLAWLRLRSLTTSEYLLVLEGTAKVRLDQLSNDGDSTQNEIAINALRDYLLVLRLQGSGAVSEIDRVTREALEQLSRPGQPALSAAQCRLLLGTATSFITCRRFAEAEEVLSRVGACLPSTATTHRSPAQRVLPTYLFIMGFLRYVTGRPDEAINYFLQTYNALEKARGPYSSAVADILLALIDFPGLLQRPEDMEHWRKKLAEVQAVMLACVGKGAKQTAGDDHGSTWDGPLDTDVNTGTW